VNEIEIAPLPSDDLSLARAGSQLLRTMRECLSVHREIASLSEINVVEWGVDLRLNHQCKECGLIEKRDVFGVSERVSGRSLQREREACPNTIPINTSSPIYTPPHTSERKVKPEKRAQVLVVALTHFP